jgi:hypothetical protein
MAPTSWRRTVCGGRGSSCELKFIGKFKESESPSNDAMVSGASKFPG